MLKALALVLLALAAVPAAMSSHSATNDQSPAWSPDGARIAFFARHGGAGGIWIANVDGSGHRLAAPGALQPAWSPDGRRLALVVDEDIVVLDLDSGTRTPIVTHRWPDWQPSWSPDGRRIAFYRRNQDVRRSEIWVVDADGSNERLLSAASNAELTPSWSPDSASIVFQSLREGNQFDLYVMRADGSQQRRLTATPDRWEGEPSWSPDGTRIAFSAGADASARDIYTIAVDGSDERRVTSRNAPLWGPKWSPDGTRLVFFEFPPGRIQIVNADGSALRRLFVAPGVGSFATRPARPVAGTRFTAVMRVNGAQGGGTITCTAVVGARTLRPSTRTFAGGVGRCAWRVPRWARAKILRGAVTVTTENGQATRRFAARVR